MPQKDVIWQPHARQADFLSVPDTVFEALYGGAAGGGKTDCLLNFPIARKFIWHPRFKGIIFRRTFPELEREIIVRSKQQGFYKGFGGKYNESRKRWEFVNPETKQAGGIVAFGHIENDSDVKRYDSDEYNYIAFDELTSFSEYVYKYMYSRCRSSSPELPAIIRSGTNPGNIGNLWVRTHFVEPAKEGNTIIRDKVTGLKRIFIPAFVDDNPYLLHADPNYKAKLLAMPEEDRNAKLYGDWYVFGGQSFSEYRDAPLESEPEHACHVCDDFEIPLWWPRLLVIDWGGSSSKSANTVAVWGALSPAGRLFVYREQVWTETKISSWTADVKRASQGEKISNFILCASAWQDRGGDETIAEQVHRLLEIEPGRPRNQRVAGKQVIHEYLRWTQRPKLSSGVFSNEIASKIMNLSGLAAYKEYINSFREPEEEKNLPKLQIFRTCVEARKIFPLCVTAKNNPEDVEEFKGDDMYDVIRYACMEADATYREDRARDTEDYIGKKLSIQSDLARTGDQTSYYRRMESFERKSSSTSIRPVRATRRARPHA